MILKKTEKKILEAFTELSSNIGSKQQLKLNKQGKSIIDLRQEWQFQHPLGSKTWFLLDTLNISPYFKKHLV